MSASAWGFIGKFSAPGTGEVGVLGLELEHDFDTGMKSGVVRLETRPYWEGGATPFTLEMPVTGEREAMRLTGLWIERGMYDGEGCCPITVTGVKVQVIPAMPTLDESTDPVDLDWGALRSACHRKAWREAWEIVGTDHTGDATPGEVYIFGVARQVRAVAAALASWRRVEEDAGVTRIGCAPGAPWARIKRIAGRKSQAAAQYARRAPKTWECNGCHGMGENAVGRTCSVCHGSGRVTVREAYHVTDARITVGGRELTMYDRGETVIVDDPVPPRMISTPHSTPGLLGELQAMQRTVDAQSTRRTTPNEIITTHEIAARLALHLEHNDRNPPPGLPGILKNPMFTARSNGSYVVVAPNESTERARRRDTSPAPQARKKDKRSARHTQRRK